MVDEQQAFLTAVQLEVGEEVVVVAVAQRAAVAVAKDVVEADHDVGLEALGHLKGVGWGWSDGLELGERAAGAVAGQRFLAEQVDAAPVEGHGTGRARPGRGDAADEVATGAAAELALHGRVGGGGRHTYGRLHARASSRLVDSEEAKLGAAHHDGVKPP